jgi:hypothetical protein
VPASTPDEPPTDILANHPPDTAHSHTHHGRHRTLHGHFSDSAPQRRSPTSTADSYSLDIAGRSAAARRGVRGRPRHRPTRATRQLSKVERPFSYHASGGVPPVPLSACMSTCRQRPEYRPTPNKASGLRPAAVCGGLGSDAASGDCCPVGRSGRWGRLPPLSPRGPSPCSRAGRRRVCPLFSPAVAAYPACGSSPGERGGSPPRGSPLPPGFPAPHAREYPGMQAGNPPCGAVAPARGSRAFSFDGGRAADVQRRPLRGHRKKEKAAASRPPNDEPRRLGQTSAVPNPAV